MAYPSPAFREDRTDVLHAAIRDLYFGVLVTHPDSGFATSYLPWELDATRGRTACWSAISPATTRNRRWAPARREADPLV